ncbi:putative protein phosphatase 2C 8 [Apostasia shenzhenica]|uniref:protein-serine/threonine phosphatase n=1 Tax=Apostasia shenzhenica TaxID=1088818 RepID=A0A2I0AK74_9ASPA|nr:putative protein phosphatase 2C 8 [Apostasia shenzhenica]
MGKLQGSPAKIGYKEGDGRRNERGGMRGSLTKKAQLARMRRLHLQRMKAAGAGDGPAKTIRGENQRTSSLSPMSSTSSSPSSSPHSDETTPPPPSDFKVLRFPCVSHGSVSLIGWRREMEDAVKEAPAFFGEEYDFFAVYDGHGGARVAEACRERMHVVLAEAAASAAAKIAEGEEERWRKAMAASFARVDGEVSAEAVAGEGAEVAEKTMGSTAVVAVVGMRQIVVANCGDSRAVLSRGGVAVPLSSDHKPNRSDEMERVEAAGGRVINWDGYRVLGVLSTSRSIGDYYLKPYVNAEPEVTVTDRTDYDEFLILASDGLWDVVSNETACKITRQCLSGQAMKMFPKTVKGSSASAAASLLAEVALSRGSGDNISVVVVQLAKLFS